jgi:hypothetical protein
MTRQKREREQLEVVEALLKEGGVHEWEVFRTGRNHLCVRFEYRDRSCSCVISSSSDWQAVKNTRAKVRAILNGRA